MNLMKNFSRRAVLLLVVLAFLFIVSFEKSEATCPSGSVELTQNFTYLGCNYTVTYCLKCGEYDNPNEVMLISIGLPNSNPCYNYFMTHSREFIDYVRSEVLLKLASTACTYYYPCSLGTKYIIVNVPLCWQKMYYNDGVTMEFRMQACGYESYCEWIFSYCYDYNLNEYRYEYVGRTTILGNNGICSELMWPDCTDEYLMEHPNLWCTCWLFYDCPNRN